eukprot:TRINITY_DN17758_c0_g1_i5.p1 TRINITY_DN17758_c0_g1~~TRINITY_DN17758_c0_g1_i5.p1  ORF type:complete len:333 (-),score=42.94 TRINITY_DN17758_c0_g1_i5:313-1311(-)
MPLPLLDEAAARVGDHVHMMPSVITNVLDSLHHTNSLQHAGASSLGQQQSRSGGLLISFLQQALPQGLDGPTPVGHAVADSQIHSHVPSSFADVASNTAARHLPDSALRAPAASADPHRHTSFISSPLQATSVLSSRRQDDIHRISTGLPPASSGHFGTSGHNFHDGTAAAASLFREGHGHDRHVSASSFLAGPSLPALIDARNPADFLSGAAGHEVVNKADALALVPQQRSVAACISAATMLGSGSLAGRWLLGAASRLRRREEMRAQALAESEQAGSLHTSSGDEDAEGSRQQVQVITSNVQRAPATTGGEPELALSTTRLQEVSAAAFV